jgi:hypothetical protein
VFRGRFAPEEHQDSADQVNADSRHGDYRETLAQATVGGRAASSDVVELPSGGCHHAVDHSSESSTARQLFAIMISPTRSSTASVRP